MLKYETCTRHLPHTSPSLSEEQFDTALQRFRDVVGDKWVLSEVAEAETIISLTAPIPDGGAGVDIADLAISEAWTTTDQGQVLKRWKELLAGGPQSCCGGR